MLRQLKSLAHDEDGNDMIEYALLAAFISIVALASLQAIAPLVLSMYRTIQTALGG